MKHKLKNNQSQERKVYVPASVKVMEVTSMRIICVSGSNEESEEGNASGWFI